MTIFALIDEVETELRQAEEREKAELAAMVTRLQAKAVDVIERLTKGIKGYSIEPMKITNNNGRVAAIWIQITIPGLMPFFVCSTETELLLTSWGQGRERPGALAWPQIKAKPDDEKQVAKFLYEMKQREIKEEAKRKEMAQQEAMAEQEKEISRILRQMNRVSTSPDFITDPNEINRLVDRLIELAPERKQDWQELTAKWAETLGQRDKRLEREAQEEVKRRARQQRYEARKAEYEAAYRAYLKKQRERMTRNNDGADMLRRVHGDAVLTLVDVVYSVPDPSGGNEWSEKTDVCLFCEQGDQFYHVIEPGGKIKKWIYTSIVRTSAPYQVKVRDLGNRAGIVYLSDYGVEGPIRFSPVLDAKEARQQIYRTMIQLPEAPDTSGLYSSDLLDIHHRVIDEA